MKTRKNKKTEELLEKLEPKTSDNLLTLKGVGKHYGSIIALRGVDMVVDPGKVTCVPWVITAPESPR